MNESRILRVLTCLAVCLVIGWVVHAAPFGPQGPRLTVEQLTLRNLKEFRLEVSHVDRELVEVGVDAADVKIAFRKHFTGAGFKLVRDADAPVVKLVVFAETDPNQPEAMAVSFVIAVHQNVVLTRLDEEATVPTAFFTQTELTTRSRAGDRVMQELRTMTRRVIQIARRASGGA